MNSTKYTSTVNPNVEETVLTRGPAMEELTELIGTQIVARNIYDAKRRPEWCPLEEVEEKNETD